MKLRKLSNVLSWALIQWLRTEAADTTTSLNSPPFWFHTILFLAFHNPQQSVIILLISSLLYLSKSKANKSINFECSGALLSLPPYSNMLVQRSMLPVCVLLFQAYHYSLDTSPSHQLSWFLVGFLLADTPMQLSTKKTSLGRDFQIPNLPLEPWVITRVGRFFYFLNHCVCNFNIVMPQLLFSSIPRIRLIVSDRTWYNQVIVSFLKHFR